MILPNINTIRNPISSRLHALIKRKRLYRYKRFTNSWIAFKDLFFDDKECEYIVKVWNETLAETVRESITEIRAKELDISYKYKYNIVLHGFGWFNVYIQQLDIEDEDGNSKLIDYDYRLQFKLTEYLRIRMNKLLTRVRKNDL